MIRSLLATLVGITLSVIVIFAMEAVGHMLFPPQLPLDPSDWNKMATYVASQPLPAQLWIPLGYTVGATAGVFAAGFYGRPSRLPAFLVTGFLVSAVIWNLTQIPHPGWLSALSVAAIVFGALTGLGLAQSRKAKRSGQE